MKKLTSKIEAGDIMSSGEIVISAKKSGSFGRNVKLNVTLKNPKNNKHRLASWNYYGMVFVRQEAIK